MVTLIVTTGPSSMDQYSYWLHRYLQMPVLVTDIYQKSSEQFNISWINPTAWWTVIRDLRFIKAIRRCRGVIHLPNHHLGRYAHFLPHPFIITAHDIIRLLDVKGYGPYIHRPNGRDRVYLKLDYRGVRKAAKVIVPSQHSKEDLMRHLGIPEEKIAVIPHGVDTATFRPLRARRPCPEPYILYVGAEHPRKNLRLLFEAFHQLKQEGRFRNLKLVKVGRVGGREHDFRADTLRMIRTLGLEGDVILQDFVSQEDLVSFYSQAEVFAFPSIYEGFGWPPLEAMACGCPVVASQATSVVEVVGRAALMRDPQDVDGWVEALAQVLTDEGTRKKLILEGMERVKEFPWERTARLTLDVYREVEQLLPVKPWPRAAAR